AEGHVDARGIAPRSGDVAVPQHHAADATARLHRADDRAVRPLGTVVLGQGGPNILGPGRLVPEGELSGGSQLLAIQAELLGRTMLPFGPWAGKVHGVSHLDRFS